MLILLPRVFAQPRPKADIGQIEIPQRSIAVLSFVRSMGSTER
jgi:hypothetical protein